MRPDLAPARRPPTRRVIAPTIAAAIAGLVLVTLLVGPLSGLFDSPSFIARLKFVNPSEYDLSIDATDDDRDSWVSVGTARREATTVVEQVIDQGDVWIFRFAGQGRDAGELRLTRGDLEATKWTVRIPDRIAEELRAKGATRTP